MLSGQWRLWMAVGQFLLGIFTLLPLTAVANSSEWRLQELQPIETVPVLPGSSEFPIQLVTDDGTAESAFGVTGQTSRPFMWLKAFEAPVDNFELEEIWVLFPQDPAIPAGASIQLVVYRDADGIPNAGSELLMDLDTTVQVADGGTFSIYPLPTPISTRDGDHVLIGVVSRFVVAGVTPPIEPAALDSSTSLGNSWVATWISDPPDPPSLPPDQSLFQIETLAPGTWMIRSFGAVTPITAIPTLGGAGLAVLSLILAWVGWRRLRSGRT